MKQINFIKPDPAQEQARRIQRAIEVGSALCVGYFVLSTVGLFVRMHFQSREIDRLELQSAELERKIGPLKEQVEQAQLRRKEYDSMQSIFDRKSGWSQTFREFSRLLPHGVWFTGLASVTSEQGRRFVLRGESLSQSKMADFLNELSHSRFFQGAVIVYSEREPNVHPEVYRFELSIPLQGALSGGAT